MKIATTPWWQTDVYDGEEAVPAAFRDTAGPNGPALVRAWPDGRTDPGWGAEQFVKNYLSNSFHVKRALKGYDMGTWAFAFVMRGFRMVCIDIDGKNGGLEGARDLGALPPTLAEVSKSGNGYHLFYLVDDEWDEVTGFSLLGDRIALAQGVDVRGTGCVYHFSAQRWNVREPVMLPIHLYDQLTHRDQKIAATQARIEKILSSDDDLEVMMLHDELLSDLAKPMVAGSRNNTLFAIGSQMATAGVPDWADKVEARALQVGLDTQETAKLIRNLTAQAAKNTP